MIREQKRAFYGIVIFGGVMLAIILLFIFNDPATIKQNKPLEITYVVLLAGGIILYIIMHLLTGKRKAEEDYAYDERDALIAKRARNAQLIAVLAAVTIWGIALSQIYRDGSGIPTPFMFIMLNTVYFINMLARSVSIYHGYRMSIENLEKESGAGRSIF